jgi:hypothetical protein
MLSKKMKKRKGFVVLVQWTYNDRQKYMRGAENPWREQEEYSACLFKFDED